MQLPTQLKRAIEQQSDRIGLKQLVQAATELSDNYRFRQGATTRFIATEAHRIAYAATRMPATYAAVLAVLREAKRLLPDESFASLLDLGAGPGTASWAACEVFAPLQKITLIERDRELIRLGQTFAAQASDEVLQRAEWLAQDLSQVISFAQHDVVICSYALGELSLSQARQVVQTAWQAAGKALVILEPGTMKGFALLRQLRADLLVANGNIIAPCPHQQTCPMPEADWCHFAARVERSAMHRKLKGGALGYEDEKYAYLVVTKSPADSATARILRHPKQHSGFIQFQLCTKEGLQEVTVTRRDKEAFKQARKANWGEAWSNHS
ncbi:MAG: rRNA methyltransferase [Acidobacteria bacterium]|nr:rRNA methyltransferase [Acidobacteriota bacterium]